MKRLAFALILLASAGISYAQQVGGGGVPSGAGQTSVSSTLAGPVTQTLMGGQADETLVNLGGIVATVTADTTWDPAIQI